MNCIININKPAGRTSHDIVYFVRRLLGLKKVGHTGTLDPDATGVLPICVGKATRAAELLTNADKAYRATFVLGITTDTQDASGTPTIQCKNINLTEEEIKAVIFQFTGNITQIPPMYSAVKVGGKKLYELARAGIEIERKERHITIFDIEIREIDLHNIIIVNQTEVNAPKITIDVKCSKGTYIRTLCADIGEKLGCGAHMTALVRTQSGQFKLEDSHTLDALERAKEEGRLLEYLTPLEDLFSQYSDVTVSGRDEILAKNGGSPRVQDLVEDETYRVFSENGEFLSLSQAKDGRLCIIKNFH
ncbi:MAG: tRNA pseudouridine(55) synthase TruB [Oscillospiraceae bacterium]|nr:tRNA pseudouridine(55) synthase TruB [Oscillospiraceae bacterium]